MKRNRKNIMKDMRAEWRARWDTAETGAWTREVITDLEKWLDRKNGQVNYYTTQMLTGHGASGAYLYGFKKRPSLNCEYCAESPIDDVSYTILRCPK